jgi:hypothetical protein
VAFFLGGQSTFEQGSAVEVFTWRKASGGLKLVLGAKSNAELVKYVRNHMIAA